jgi:hypothetical protein
MTDLEPLGPEEAAARIGRAGPAARGFLGVDSVVDNDAAIAKALRAGPALAFAWGPDAVLGALTNPDNPRQVLVAGTSRDPESLLSLLDFLAKYKRCTSALARAASEDPLTHALNAAGFTETGRLRGHYYRSGSYLDMLVYYRTLEPR